MRTMLLALAVMLPMSSPAATFYVGPAGNNGSDGSSAAPWLTLQHAADSIAAGDTVMVLPGTYAGFNVTKSGRPQQRTVFSARPGVRIDTAAAPLLGDHRARINLHGVSHVVIEGFEVIGSNNSATSRDGIRIVSVIENRSRDIVIRRNHVHDNFARNILSSAVTGLVVEDNVVGSAFTEDGILIMDSADNHVIRGNIVHSNRGSGIKLHAQRYPGGDGIVSNALIENNRVYSNGASAGAGIYLDGVRASVIQNNLLYDNHATGIGLFHIDGSMGSGDNLVANNTVVNAADGRWALSVQGDSAGNTVLNNILFSLNPIRGSIEIDAASRLNFAADHNLLENQFASESFMDIGQWRAMTGGDASSATLTLAELEALFANYEANDFQLASGSTAIDAGAANPFDWSGAEAPLYDLLMAKRPGGGAYDIGAFEALPVPEPATWAMLFAGCALVAGATARRRRRHEEEAKR